MAKKVTLELTEAQAHTVKVALEEWFRLRMGQGFDLATDLAFHDYHHDKGNPEGFNARIQTRDAVHEVIKAMFRVAFGPAGSPNHTPPYVHIASDIWSALRWELSEKGEWDRIPFQMGPEPMPKITVEETE